MSCCGASSKRSRGWISGGEIDREQVETRVVDTELEAAWRAVLRSVEQADPDGSA